MPELSDYEKTYMEHWRKIVEQPDGTLNLDQVKRELCDYWDLMGRVAEVYDGVTGGRISKTETMAFEVINQANERTEEACDDAINDLIESLEMAEMGPFESTANVVSAIRELTGVMPQPR